VNKGTKIAAWLLTGLYVVVALVLLSRFGLGDGSGGNWERALTIFNAFSAIGFAAVGVLLGTTVQQVNVSNAQNQAVAAKTSEDRMAEQAKKTIRRRQEEARQHFRRRPSSGILVRPYSRRPD